MEQRGWSNTVVKTQQMLQPAPQRVPGMGGPFAVIRKEGWVFTPQLQEILAPGVLVEVDSFRPR